MLIAVSSGIFSDVKVMKQGAKMRRTNDQKKKEIKNIEDRAEKMILEHQEKGSKKKDGYGIFCEVRHFGFRSN